MQKNTEAKPHHGLAIAGLILNILVLPGLGTLIGGETKKGVWQMVLALTIIPIILLALLSLSLGSVGAFAVVLVVGIILWIPLVIAMWIWALVCSIKQIKASS